MRLIDADALKERIRRFLSIKSLDDLLPEEKAIVQHIDRMPTVDAVPVVHGHWVKKRYWSEGVGMGESYGYWYACSECNHEVRSGYDRCDDKFCSNCGARNRRR